MAPRCASLADISAAIWEIPCVEVYEAVPRDSDPTRQDYDDAWAQAEALKQRVMAFLVKKGCAVTGAGIIHLGGVQPIRAAWRSDPYQPVTGGDNGDTRLSQPTLS
jgi:hypothetical protein